MFLHMSHPAIQLVFLDGKALILSSDGRHLNVGTIRFLWKDSSGSGIFAWLDVVTESHDVQLLH